MLDSWEKILDSNFTNAELIGPVGTEKVLTIKDIDKAECNDPDSKKGEKKVVTTLYFVEDELPMVLNKTNGKTLMKLFGNDPRNCIGKKIVLKVEWIKSFGGTTAIRIHEYNPVNCEVCGGAVLPTKKMTIAKVVEYSKKNCSGRVLCMNCMRKAAEKKKEESNE